ncbi:hypothetical protein Cgig2_001936 [Carnegiea gigantea]|uniref:Uncharacterized protein n=1 Tax=Carnegiea gigantea TaxID=171969 RepID=A0A9Q1Q8C6_9CARY|nr:hypothetical protein Cgig2_001936 [Carnegiea gigantea]
MGKGDIASGSVHLLCFLGSSCLQTGEDETKEKRQRLTYSRRVSQQRQSAGGKENIQPNSLQGVNKSCTTQISKKHISVANRMENSTIGMPRPHNLVNQSCDQNTSTGENTNTSGCLNQSNIARRLNLDQREQLKCIHKVSKGDRLTSMPSALSRELMSSRVINPYATTQVLFFSPPI